MKYNFIRTQDECISKILQDQGFKLVDNKNGLFTFINDKPLKFSDSVDVSKLHYTNTLHI